MKSLGNTKLYRTLKKKITSISNKELLKQLNIAYNNNPVGFHPERAGLLSAFAFNSTPQGHKYWWALYEESEPRW